MPLKLQTLEQHQTAKPSQFNSINPKDLTQLKKEKSAEQYFAILHQITFRTHTSPNPLGSWSFTVTILTEGKEINWLCS